MERSSTLLLRSVLDVLSDCSRRLLSQQKENNFVASPNSDTATLHNTTRNRGALNACVTRLAHCSSFGKRATRKTRRRSAQCGVTWRHSSALTARLRSHCRHTVTHSALASNSSPVSQEKNEFRNRRFVLCGLSSLAERCTCSTQSMQRCCSC